MTHSNDNTSARKGKHLSYSERSQITILKQEGYSNRRIANILNRVPQTINNEVRRGTFTQLKRQKQKGKTYDYYTKTYDADARQAAYDKHRLTNVPKRSIIVKHLVTGKLTQLSVIKKRPMPFCSR